MSNELLPCPFCGGEKIGKITVNPSLEPRRRRFKVYCIECQVRTQDHRTRKEAKEAWNQRSQSAPAGFVMVPVEPNLNMVIAGENYIGRHAYSKMIAAAPKAERQPVSDEARDAWMPISTAPMGSGESGPEDVSHPDYIKPPKILLMTDEGIVVGYYDWYYHAGYGRGADPDEPAWRDHNGERTYGATHWMPLPAAMGSKDDEHC